MSIKSENSQISNLSDNSLTKSIILKPKQVKEVETQQTMQRIQNEAHLEHQKALADAEAYRKSKEAESNAVLFTPEFLKYEEIKGINSVSKVYFGEKIPTYLADTAKLVK